MSISNIILVIAEHDGQKLKKSTLSTIACAQQLGEVHVFVVGSDCANAASTAAEVDGVKKVLHCDDERYAHPLSETLAPLVVANSEGYSHLLASASTFGKDLMPRVAALLDVDQVSEVISVIAHDTFKRPIYAGNAIATVQTDDAVKVLTVRTTAFEAGADTGGNGAVEQVPAVEASVSTQFLGQQTSRTDRPEITSARIIISGGRAMGSAENFQLLDTLANQLGAAIGASRAAVDAGYAPNDCQVGQSGKMVAPELYIAVGISGAIQHIAGIKDSKVIVAINKDPEAPIFQVADYGLVADLFDAIPEMTRSLG